MSDEPTAPDEPLAEPATDDPESAAPVDDDVARAPIAASPLASPAATPPFQPNYVFLAVVAGLTLAVDFGTKAWATANLEGPAGGEPHRVDVIADHVAFLYARNAGGAWGLLSDEGARWFFVLVSVGAIVFILSLYRKLTASQIALKWGLAFVLGGAFGNAIDRLRYAYVVDFIDVKAKMIGALNGMFGSRTDHWPTFNVADVAIVVGVGLMAVDMFTAKKPQPAGTPALPGPKAQAAALGASSSPD
ncbi:MAG TPA: signal peptidase II [Byssovorax sp.]|jgi:signal peptidase II